VLLFLHSELLLLEDMGFSFFTLHAATLRKGEHTVARQLDMSLAGLGGGDIMTGTNG
jgi:hypothetical protein